MHLTNYSVNKTSPKFKQNTDQSWRGSLSCVSERRTAAATQGEAFQACAAEEEEDSEAEECEDGEAKCSKWSLTELRAYFAEHNLDYQDMFSNIKDLVIKTLLSAEHQIRAVWKTALEEHEDGVIPRRRSHASNCFEIYGFDIMIDSDMKPWLLEVNICPSLSSGSPLDKRIKTKLVADTLTLVGIPAPSGWSGLRAAGLEEGRQSQRRAREAGNADEEALPPPDELARRAANLARCSGAEALRQFDDLAWDLVMDAHDEDMRRGSLERIFPEADASRYAPYFGEETYGNVVLCKWQEAGGADVFRPGQGPQPPPWVPRQVAFRPT